MSVGEECKHGLLSVFELWVVRGIATMTVAYPRTC